MALKEVALSSMIGTSTSYTSSPLLHLQGAEIIAGRLLVSGSTGSLNSDGDGATWSRRHFASSMDVEQGRDAVWKRRGGGAVRGEGNRGRGGEDWALFRGTKAA
jgi:hypothetical protein